MWDEDFRKSGASFKEQTCKKSTAKYHENLLKDLDTYHKQNGVSDFWFFVSFKKYMQKCKILYRKYAKFETFGYKSKTKM